MIAGCSGLVKWFENSAGSPPTFTESFVGSCASPVGIFAARVDADADIDVLCSDNSVPGKVRFVENDGSAGRSGCSGQGDCLDSLFCNGAETCVGGTCQAGPPSCSSPFMCRESDDQCVSCLGNLDCDDGLFCNGVETCSASGVCLAGSNPCPGLSCNETTNTCTQNGTRRCSSSCHCVFSVLERLGGFGALESERTARGQDISGP